MYIKYFDTTVVDQLVDRVVVQLERNFPVSKIRDTETQGLLLPKISELIRQQTRNGNNLCRMNVYQKAKYGIRLQEALQEIGYPRVFSKLIAREATMILALVSSQLR